MSGLPRQHRKSHSNEKTALIVKFIIIWLATRKSFFQHFLFQITSTSFSFEWGHFSEDSFFESETNRFALSCVFRRLAKRLSHHDLFLFLLLRFV